MARAQALVPGPCGTTVSGGGRLAELGFDCYADYLASPHWQERRRIAGDAANWRCACGKRATQIHHRSYRNLGREKAKDLRAVCNGCHVEIHRRCKGGMSLTVATDAVLKPRPRPGVVRLPDAKRPDDYGRKSKKHHQKRKKKKKKKSPLKALEGPPPSKRMGALAAENDRLHAVQARNRERQEAAKAARAPRIDVHGLRSSASA